MKANLPTQVGIGFTIVVAAATFLVAVVAALFLIWQPDANTLAQQRAASQISLAASSDVRRGADTTQPPSSLGGVNPMPQPVQ
jgi:hypothetical protein